ncbi:HlyD family secretion protein [bacterium]|nr:HlyD family secretion protein [bacterium]
MLRFIITITIVVTIAAILYAVPVKIPYSIEAPGKIVPLKEWILVRGEDGLLSATLYNNVLNLPESYSITHVERGDHVTFRLNEKLMSCESVAAGDTVGFVNSHNVELQWAQLRGELSTELATLKLYETGDKESLVREARFQLDYAQKQVEHQKTEISRLVSLAEKKMIPEADMEREETTLRLLEINTDIAKARLITAQTGSKKEQNDLVRARITALRDEIDVLEKRLRLSTITSPISGRLVRFSRSDTLAVVQCDTRYAVVFPARWEDRTDIVPHQRVRLSVEGLETQPEGEIEHLCQNVFVVNGRQLLRVAAVIEEGTTELSPGVIANCSVICPPVRLYEYILRYFGQ